MNSKEWILRFVKKHGVIRTDDVVRSCGISRQAAAKHIRELVRKKKLSKRGSTRAAHYVSFNPHREKPGKGIALSFSRSLKGLQEDRVFDEAAEKLSLRKRLSPAAFKVAQYAFTEMLNNAIDHSKASRVSIHLVLVDGVLRFKIADRGIGAFESVRRKFKFKNNYEAAEHLLKGKQTTDPSRHTGQGIFFTSKIADHFMLESRRLKLDVNNERNDIGLLDVNPCQGTVVSFSLKQRSRKGLKKVFDEYSDANLDFDKTRVRVRLSPKEGDYVSRSEAKRILFGLEKFRHILIDFEGVNGIGQAFADEVFRVFSKHHPEISIEPTNMSPSVSFMVGRAKVSRSRP